jgi:crotonobetainyl-CoA:carnitine CoA-transferase CaiB-like acyl-CoA transferase
MADGVLTWLYWALGSGLAAGRWPVPGRELVTGGSPRYRLYETADGRHVAAAPLEDRFWDGFCDLVQMPDELRDDARDPEATTAAVAALIAARPAAYWERRFGGSDVCCTIVRSVEEAAHDPAFHNRGLFASTTGDGSGATMTALPVPIDGALRAGGAHATAPALGEHNAELEGVRA